MSVDFDVRGQQGTFSPLKEELLWTMGSYFGQKWWLKMPWWISFLQTCSFLLYKTVINRLVPFDYCGLLWCFNQLFGLSFWRHPFTADDPLVNVMLNFFKSVLMKKQTHLGWSEYIFSKCSFWVNCSFYTKISKQMQLTLNGRGGLKI